MPRQPLNQVIPSKRKWALQFGIDPAAQNTKLVAIIGQCLITWTYVEAELGVILGHLLHAKSDQTLAVFQILRRSASQYEALAEAGKYSLDERDQELLSALLTVHRSIEAERNALAHGHIGTCDAVPHAVAWIATTDFIHSRVKLNSNRTDYDFSSELAQNTFVYREKDLTTIRKDIGEMWSAWLQFSIYLDIWFNYGWKNDRACDQLRSQPRIAEALDVHRRRKEAAS